MKERLRQRKGTRRNADLSHRPRWDAIETEEEKDAVRIDEITFPLE